MDIRQDGDHEKDDVDLHHSSVRGSVPPRSRRRTLDGVESVAHPLFHIGEFDRLTFFEIMRDRLAEAALLDRAAEAHGIEIQAILLLGLHAGLVVDRDQQFQGLVRSIRDDDNLVLIDERFPPPDYDRHGLTNLLQLRLKPADDALEFGAPGDFILELLGHLRCELLLSFRDFDRRFGHGFSGLFVRNSLSGLRHRLAGRLRAIGDLPAGVIGWQQEVK